MADETQPCAWTHGVTPTVGVHRVSSRLQTRPDMTATAKERHMTRTATHGVDEPKPSTDELAAAAIVERTLKVRAIARDPEGGVSFDFLLERDGAHGALEVTSRRDQGLTELREVLKKNPSGFRVPGITKTWWLFPIDRRSTEDDPLPRVKQIAHEIGPLLRRLEQRACDQFIFDHETDSRANREMYSRWGIEAAIARESDGYPDIVYFEPSSAACIPDDLLCRSVEALAAHKASQLRAHGSAFPLGGHVFVWIYDSAKWDWYVFQRGSMPGHLPHLPAEVDTVWLADWVEDGSIQVWTASRRGWVPVIPRDQGLTLAAL